MKYNFQLLLLCLSLTFIKSYAQLKEVPITRLNALRESGKNCMDSSGVLSTFCSLDMSGFEVEFYKIFYDKKLKQLQLIGRTCTSNQVNGAGVSNVTIFQGTKVANIVKNKNIVGESTYGADYINNDGFFSIIISIGPAQRLFFHRPGYFIVEYNVSKLL